jgi:5-methyltetrahydropteroyltriglutamate--homocysteine methyltransferase
MRFAARAGQCRPQLMEPRSMTMPFLTAVVGSLPKPAWLLEPIALNAGGGKQVHGRGADWLLEGEVLKNAQDDAVRLALRDQERAGIDFVSDGEQRRKSWLTYVTSRLAGFDYENLVEKSTRAGRRIAQVGQCIGPVRRGAPIVLDDLRFAQSETNLPVSIALPGPLSVADSTYDAHYGDERRYALAIAAALNEEARALDALAPAFIQLDEPAFSRYPEKVKQWGIEALEVAIDGVRSTTALHVCYSYPMPGVPRPIVDSYPVILKELEASSVDQLSLEFELANLDPQLLKLCPSKTVMFGCISNGSEDIETPAHVASRLMAAARFLPADQIMAAPDCGLVPLSQGASRAKLRVMVEGARLARKQIEGR